MEREGGSLVRPIPTAALAAAILLLSIPAHGAEEAGRGASALVVDSAGSAQATVPATASPTPSPAHMPATAERAGGEHGGGASGESERPPRATVHGETVLVESTRPAEGIAASAAQEHLDLAPYTARAVHTGDVLARVPGVEVQRYGGIGQGSYVRIRGSTPAQVLVVVDGVRMNPVAGGGTDLDSVPLELLASVDVVRGAGAARYGADALGGVVVFRTEPSRTGAAAAVTAGSTGNARVSASASAPAGGWTLDASVRHEQAPDTFRYRDDYRSEFRTRENTGARAFGASAGARTTAAGGRLRARIWGTTMSAGAPGLSEQPTTEASRGEDRLTAVVRWDEDESAGGGGTLWSVEASSRFESQRYDNPRPFANSGAVHSASAGTSVSAGAFARRAFGSRLLLAGGLDGRDERIDDLDVGRRARQVGGARGSAGLFLLGGRLELDAALRLEGVSGAGDTAFAALPSAGATLRGPWWTARAHVGRSYRLPTFTELYLPEMETAGGNPDLEPEDAWSGDAGVSVCAGDGARAGATLEATVFQTRIDDAIVFAPVSAHRFRPVNTGPSWIYGVETAASVVLPWDFELRGTWTRTESYREATGEPLPLRPRDRVTGRVSSRPLAGPLEVFVEGSWASGAYADFFGNLTVPAGEVLGGGLTLSIARGPLAGLAVTAEATNVTDADVRDALFFPQPGRALWLTLRWRGTPGRFPEENRR